MDIYGGFMFGFGFYLSKKKKMFGFGFQCNVELRSWV